MPALSIRSLAPFLLLLPSACVSSDKIAAPPQAAEPRGAANPPATTSAPRSAATGSAGASVTPHSLPKAAAATTRTATALAAKSPAQQRTDEDEPADLAPDRAPPRASREPRDTAPRERFDIQIRRGESMGLYGRWAKLAMRDLYSRTDLAWGGTLTVGRTLSFRFTPTERARFDEGRTSFHRSRESAHAQTGVERYKVRRGESSWHIARRRGVPLWLLEKMNPGRDLSRLSAGDEIRLPSRGGES
jgi:hypothetical protein